MYNSRRKKESDKSTVLAANDKWVVRLHHAVRLLCWLLSSYKQKENLTFFIFYDIINIENEKEIKGNQLLSFKLLDIIPTKVF